MSSDLSCSSCGSKKPQYICSQCKGHFFCSVKCQETPSSPPCVPNGDIEKLTNENIFYRKVLWTTSNMQVVLMNLPVGDFIEMEIHPETDQFFRVEEGKIMVITKKSKEGNEFEIIGESGFAFVIPKGTLHKIVNIGDTNLKLYTIYSPPHHDADKAEIKHM